MPDNARGQASARWSCRHRGRLVVTVDVTTVTVLRTVEATWHGPPTPAEREAAAAWLGGHLPALTHDERYALLSGDPT